MNDTCLKNLRVLIVEDDEPTALASSRDLERAFPGVIVDCAPTVAGGSQLLAKARRAGVTYDFAILDFRLPPERVGQATVSDFSIRNEIRDLSPATFIIQVSAHKDDADIRRFQETHAELSQDYPTFVPKEGDWTQTVIRAMICAIHSRRIRRRFEALSLSADSPSSEWQSRGMTPARSDSGRSLAVAEFCVDAAQHWQFLRQAFQDQLKSTFGFAMIDGVPYLGVAEEDIEEDDEDSDESPT